MPLTKEQIAQQIARELGMGIMSTWESEFPTLVANYIPAGMKVVLQSENGLLGMGPFPVEKGSRPDQCPANRPSPRCPARVLIRR